MISGLVHVIDDDQSAREALVFLLEASAFDVRAYESAAAFLANPPVSNEGCIITDVRMPDMTGIELIHQLNAQRAKLPVIVITGHGDIPMAIEAMRAGVVDFIEKPFAEARILAALETAARSGRPDEDPTHAAIMGKLHTLSERERQVLDRVVAGQANKMIARDLDISHRTVEIYRAKVMAKMQVDNLAALVRMALAVGLG